MTSVNFMLHRAITRLPITNYVYQYGADQYYPDCYSCYPEHAEPLQGNGIPPSEEDSHHIDVQSESGDETINQEPGVSKSKTQWTKSQSMLTLPQVLFINKPLNGSVWPSKLL